MSTTTPTSNSPALLDAERYHQIQQFYATQMQLLDDGAAAAWAGTFTEDGVFAQNVKPEPWRGRAQITERMTVGLARVAASGLVRRHWFGMLAARPDGPDLVRTRYYAVVYQTPWGGRAEVYLSTMCEDELVRTDEGWLVRYRMVAHDGVG
ncbi:nuclear transport factor 2 family protein [Micromonospora zhanjiangensis]|uniref:Nuclear transport factor 2 family protein n=1 Tax=Micromonospora zhanjiangensis TaxID=1522057 RepID=A0ABV8KVQ4_9ACTN